MITIKNNFNKVKRDIEKSAEESANDIGKTLISISNRKYTPYDSGELAKSGHVVQSGESTAIIYSADYAARLYHGFVNRYSREVNSLAGPFWINRAASDNQQLIETIVADKIRGDF